MPMLFEQAAFASEGDVLTARLLIAVVNDDEFHLNSCRLRWFRDETRSSWVRAYRPPPAAWLTAKLS